MRAIDYRKTIIEIQSWIKDYFQTAKADALIIGLSGGIDSAVAAVLSLNAVGRDSLHALFLPCESISQDKQHAELIAKNFDINFMIIDLTSSYKHYLKLVDPKIVSNRSALANLKARMRMITWYYFGQSKGNCLIVGTGNRAELGIGYFTKYGDAGVDIEPIAGLYKCEVREIAKILGIPREVIIKPPSAGLWKGQTDEGEIGLSYDTIDEILYRIDYNLNFNGLVKEDVEKVKSMMQKAEHKLRIPPQFKIR